jgi:hypothetical protein
MFILDDELPGGLKGLMADGAPKAAWRWLGRQEDRAQPDDRVGLGDAGGSRLTC